MDFRKTSTTNDELDKEIQVEKTSIVLVTSEVELWGAENLRLALSSAGHRVFAASSGEVLECLERIRPDLTLANLAGGHPEDLRLCKRLARPDLPPLVVIGQSVDSSQLVALFAAGITDYLTRPVNPRELIARVNNILHRTQLPLQKPGTAVSPDQQLTSFRPVRYPLAQTLQNLAERLNRSLT